MNRITGVLAALLLGLGAPLAHGDAGGENGPDWGAVPDLTARDLDGAEFHLAEALEQGPLAVTFWATWCKPCRKELPELQRLQAAYAEHGFRVVAVSGDGPADQAKVRPYVRARKFTFVVLPDPEGEIRRRFQVEVFPTTLLVDAGGRITYRAVGYRRGDEKILETALRDLLDLEDPEPGPPPTDRDVQ